MDMNRHFASWMVKLTTALLLVVLGSSWGRMRGQAAEMSGRWPGWQYQTVPTAGPSPTSPSPTSAPSDTPTSPPQPSVTATPGGQQVIASTTASPTTGVITASPSGEANASATLTVTPGLPSPSSTATETSVPGGETVPQVVGTAGGGGVTEQTPRAGAEDANAPGSEWQVYVLVGLGVLLLVETGIIVRLRTGKKGKNGEE